MTAQEYNHDFLPRINRAEEFVELFESSIEHMSETRVDKDEVRKQFRIRGWSEETRQVILPRPHALNFRLSRTACSSQRLFFSFSSWPLTQ